MPAEPKPAPANMILVWSGRVISALPVFMLLFSAAMKFTNSKMLADGMEHLGWPMKYSIALGITELACTILYVTPQTSVLGAILLTGYLGGATATHLRVDDPFYGPVLFGVLIWLGLFLREPRLRAILPWRT
jgi:DoxX-like protein